MWIDATHKFWLSMAGKWHVEAYRVAARICADDNIEVHLFKKTFLEVPEMDVLVETT